MACEGGGGGDSGGGEGALLSSLGANVVDREQFELKLVEGLQQQLLLNQQQGQGQQETPPPEEEEGGHSNTGNCNEDQGVEPPTTSSDSNSQDQPQSSLLRGALTRNNNEGEEEEEETEHDRRVRCGEETPFGTSLSLPPASTVAKKDTFINFHKYFLEQQQLMEQKKQGSSSSSVKKKNKDKTTKGPAPSSSSKNKEGHHHHSKDKDKGPLDMNILFPKKRKRKENLGLGISDDPKDARKTPGSSLAERKSFYLNYSDDSEYVPTSSGEDQDKDSDYDPDRKKVPTKPKRKRRRKFKSLKGLEEEDNEEEDSYEEDSDDDSSSRRRLSSKSSLCRKEPDDGDVNSYRKRVQLWKESETRITSSPSSFHTFEGGFKIPLHLWEELYTYQKVGVKWLYELHLQRTGGILGDEMGLGKTIQVINFLVGIASSGTLFRSSPWRGLGPCLLITPATVMHQWVKEFHTWWPPFRVGILHESGSYQGSKSSLIRSLQESKGILITSYTSLVNNQNELLSYPWHYVILDEGHKIRNPDAQITLVAKQVKTPHRLILSGSPLQNNLKELWSLFDFIYPGKLGTLPTFMEQFAVPITHGGYANATEVQVAVAYKCAKALRDMINPYLLRRMKNDVKDHLQLPEKNEQVLFCKMTEEQRTVYKEYLDSKEIDSIIHGRFNLFVGLINLRKICNHPHLFDGGPKNIVDTRVIRKKKCPKAKSGLVEDSEEVTLDLDPEDEGEDLEIKEEGFGHWTKSGKMVVVETLLKLWHKQGQKVLLFTQSRQMLCILEAFVIQSNYNYLRLDGSTPISSRQPLITKFNSDPSIFIFILTTRVGGLGVNLTSANRLIIYDPDWNPSTDIQARERAWRIGQQREVTIYRLILSGTIEEKMYHRQVFKQFLTNRVLKDPKQKRFFKSNDLIELFTLNEGGGGRGSTTTESEAIFAGTGSAIKKPKNKVKAFQKSSGKFKNVPNLVKQRAGPEDPVDPSGDPSTSSSSNSALQDEYVLKKLFKKSGGIHAALRHDKIVDSDEPDYMIVEKEAESVAKRAVETLRRSREECWDAESGRANWTGNQGDVRRGEVPPPPAQPKLRFGSKKVPQKKKPEVPDPPEKYFSGQSLLKDKDPSSTPNLSSSDILGIIRSRKSSSDPGDPSSSSDLRPEDLDLLQDIRHFIAFQAMVDGQATTGELIEKFEGRLPPGGSPLFKEMLGQLCTFRKVEGKGVWRLKPEFR